MWCRGRLRRRRRRSCRAIQLFGDGSCLCGDGDLVVITTTPQVDDVTVMSVLENANEVPLAQAFAVAAKQLERLRPDATCWYSAIARRERRNRAPDERKRFLTR
jgi:hypothetical protein